MGTAATLDRFQGFKNANDEHLEHATAVLDAFHNLLYAGQQHLTERQQARLTMAFVADSRHE